MRLQHLLPHQLQHVIDEQCPLLVPTGCIEYHGPHLPLGVDTIITEHLLTQVAERVNCVVAPPIWYGPASHAVSGPELGSLDVSTERFGRNVLDSNAPWYTGKAPEATVVEGEQLFGIMIDAWVMRISDLDPA